MVEQAYFEWTVTNNGLLPKALQYKLDKGFPLEPQGPCATWSSIALFVQSYMSATV